VVVIPDPEEEEEEEEEEETETTCEEGDTDCVEGEEVVLVCDENGENCVEKVEDGTDGDGTVVEEDPDLIIDDGGENLVDITDTGSGESESVDLPLIIGIVVALLLVFGGVLGGYMFWLRKNKKKQQELKDKQLEEIVANAQANNVQKLDTETKTGPF
jgi:hypothetical protein